MAPSASQLHDALPCPWVEVLLQVVLVAEGVNSVVVDGSRLVDGAKAPGTQVGWLMCVCVWRHTAGPRVHMHRSTQQERGRVRCQGWQKGQESQGLGESPEGTAY